MTESWSPPIAENKEVARTKEKPNRLPRDPTPHVKLVGTRSRLIRGRTSDG